MATQLFPQERLQEKYNSLPAAVRAVLDSEDVGYQVDRISQVHDLLLDQTDVLAQEITYVLLGLRRPGDFVRYLEDRAKLKHTEAYQIGIEVEEIVFKPIREHLFNMEDRDSYQPITAPQDTSHITSTAIRQEQEHEEHHNIESADQLLAEIEHATDLPALTSVKADFGKIGQAMTTSHVSAAPVKPLGPAAASIARPAQAPVPPKPAAPATPRPMMPSASSDTATVPPRPAGVTAQSFVPKAAVTPVFAPQAASSFAPKPASSAPIPTPPKPNLQMPAAGTLEIPKIRVMPGPGTLNLKPETPVPPPAAKPSFIQQEAGMGQQQAQQPPKKYVSDPYREPIQ